MVNVLNLDFIRTIEKAKDLLSEVEKSASIPPCDFVEYLKSHKDHIKMPSELFDDANFVTCLYFFYYTVQLLEKNKPVIYGYENQKIDNRIIH